MERGRILDVFRRSRAPRPSTGEWMTLADAAMTLRGKQRGSDLDRVSRGLSQGEDSLLAFWALRVAQIGTPIYGRRIAATKLEAIPLETIVSGQIIDQATRLVVRRGEPINDFGALQVKRREFERCMG